MGLDTYLPEPRTVEACGKSVQVLPLRVRQLQAFARAVGPVIGPIAAGDLLGAVTLGGDDMIRAVSIATGETEEWLGELLPDAFLAIAAAVIEANTDFFVQRVLPALNAAAEKTTAILGVMPSPSSAPTATSTPASLITP